MNWYYKVLIHRPFLVILAITILSVACIIVSFATKDVPNFENPTLGFEARGTNIGQRLKAWECLLRETGASGKLVANPNDLLHFNSAQSNSEHFSKHLKQKSRKTNKKNNKTNSENKLRALKNYSKTGKKINLYSIRQSQYRDYDIINETSTENKPKHDYEFGWNTSGIDEDDRQDQMQTKKAKWANFNKKKPPLEWNDVTSTNGFFCESPTKEYSHFVVERIGPNSTDSLFDINSLLAMCQLEEKIIAVRSYYEYCQKNNTSNVCCRPWSISNYVALLSNKTSCFDIDQEDVNDVQILLLNCYEYFLELKLSNDCTENRCRAPEDCIRFNAVFNIFHYLADVNFVKTNSSNMFLKYSMIFLPIAQSTKILSFFHELEKTDLKNEIVQVVAMDLGLKQALFDECLFSDGWLVGFGGIFVMGCMWLYTASLFATIMTVIAVFFSLGIAYFIYTLIFELTFFPFMNLLAVVVLVGIGADDAFIFVKIWQCTILDHIKNGQSSSSSFSEPTHTDTLTNLMAVTFEHAALSIFVTSLTTAGAFYASFISSITAVRCFGIFAGTAIISNYLLMITWLPASISIMERIPCDLGKIFPQKILNKLTNSITKLCATLENYILRAVIEIPIFWIILFGSIGIASCFIVLYWPRLQLPESDDFQLFVNDHPFELYDSKFKNYFWFEKNSIAFDKLPLRFVWGLLPIDDGDYLNPNSYGELYFDNNLNVSSIESQEWLLEFCKKLKKESFYEVSAFGFLLPNCFIENFISWMNRKCIDTMDDVDRTPCCESSKFPFVPQIFEQCLPQSISSLYATPREFFIPGVAGPKFLSSSNFQKKFLEIFNIDKITESNYTKNNSIIIPPKIKVVVIEFESNFLYSMSYTEVAKFVKIVQEWFDNEMLLAPIGMKGGWFISELDFFNLQDSLSKGTIIAITTAMSASLFVLLFVTLNVLISFYAVVTVTFTIFTTVAILVLLGWRLNILESVSVSTAIGLAVDFSLHYSIQYRLSTTNDDRVSSTKFALLRIIGPTAMAAITTGIAGAFMLASKVLPYIQIGIFLVVVMTTSWTFATFFLMSLLRLIGPQNGLMQFNYPIFRKGNKNLINSKNLSERKQNEIIASEQLLTPSSSAVGELINSESHELDSLTPNSVIKQLSDYSKPPIDFQRAFNRKSTNSNNFRSPSSGSAITVLPEDNDFNNLINSPQMIK